MSRVALYLELAKSRIVSMVLVTTRIGFFLGGKGTHPLPRFLLALLGVGCATGGASVLDNYLERNFEARMKRTCNRALPAGLIELAKALIGGVSLVLFGVFLLVLTANLLTAFLVLLAAFLYVLVYTPLKRVTWLLSVALSFARDRSVGNARRLLQSSILYLPLLLLLILVDAGLKWFGGL